MHHLVRCLSVLLILTLLACEQVDEEIPEEAVARNDEGVGLMGQYRYEQARDIFQDLSRSHPDWLDVRVNLAIATLNRQEAGDEQRALEIAKAVIEADSSHLRAHYVAALMYLYQGDNESALTHFKTVARNDTKDAHAAYYIGQILSQQGRDEEAIDWYRRAIEHDPYLRSAYYGAAMVLRAQGEMGPAREMLAHYQRFQDNPRSHLAEFRYTRMGPKAEAKAFEPPDPQPLVAPEGALFETGQDLTDFDPIPPGASLTTADISGDGRLDLFLSGGETGPTRVFLNRGDGFALAQDHPLAGIEGVNAALWGDLENSGEVDVYLCRRGANQLYLREGDRWREAGSDYGVAHTGHCVDGILFDADHDGDLDLFLVNADGPNELLNNNLDGSFRPLSEESDAQLTGAERGSRQALAVDLDNDRDADLLILHRQAPHQVLLNDRLWRYQPARGLDDFLQGDWHGLTTADINADGRVSLFTLDGQGRLLVWSADAEGHWASRLITHLDLPDHHSAALDARDFTGDGRPEILVHHREGFEVLDPATSSEGAVLFRERSALSALTAVNLDPRRGPALAGIVSQDERAQLRLWAPGPGRHDFLSIMPTGRSDPADGMRSNASGIGTGLVMRAGQRWSVADTYDRHSAPGQSLQPIALGLGGQQHADFLQLFWTDGVFQTEMGLAAGERHEIAETQRQLASCPILFAWNGEEIDFVSDLLGVAGIGFFLEPGRYSDPRSWEFFKFPEGSIAPKDEQYVVKIGEPMEEIAYLDTVRLHRYELPEDWSLTLDERMHTGGGPAPSGAPVFYRESRVLHPRHAFNDRGDDLTETLSRVDQQAAPPGPPDERFLARLAEEHVLTLEFEEAINPSGSRPVLVGHGWVEYPYSQTLFSAWQAGAAYHPPTLEARGRDGQWQVVYEHFGYPAGMPREMSLPLHDLPPETTALRLRSNWEVYWDALYVVQAESKPAELRHHELAPEQARIAKTGFARRHTYEQRLPYYDYQDRTPFWDTKYPTGFYTALGPVTELVEAHNDAFAIIGPGEELHMEFPSPPAGDTSLRQIHVLEVRGYAKDMDLYTKDGETVGPLPSTPDVGNSATREALHERYLTRFQGGR